VIQYALGWDWEQKAANGARRCAIRGIAGVELVTIQGDKGDPEIGWDPVDMRDFFYDARSTRDDFDDARFMGTSRWVDLDEAQDAFPDSADDLADYIENGPQTDWNRGDERNRIAWISKPERQVRIVDMWYKLGKDWHYCIYCGNIVLEFGRSPYFDERGVSVHKYEIFSAEVDQDGDRYGFFRDLKSPQDEINHRRSKALHTLNSRKVIADEGAVDDVEVARREYARSDGWVVKNPGKEILTEDQQSAQIVQGNLTLLEDAKNEIDTYGPNPGLIGTDIPAESGRAIQLLQAAGIAELGGFVLAWRNWKLRVYRKTWNTVQKYWTSDRWIRVTDDDNLAQFIQVNGWQQDEITGQVVAINQLASLDVDIIIDEGGDALNAQADTLETLVLLAKGGIQVPPTAIVELSPLPSSVKQRVLMELAKASQPQPIQQQEIMLKMQGMQAQIQELQSKAELNMANAAKAHAEAATAGMDGGGNQQIDTAADLAKARLDLAKAGEIEARVSSGGHLPVQEPGLFEVNQAKARLAHAQADAAQTGAQMSLEQGRAGIDKIYGDQQLAAQQQGTDLGLRQQDGAMKAMLLAAQARKANLEGDTIEQAPPGMLEKPPPRPAPTGGA